MTANGHGSFINKLSIFIIINTIVYGSFKNITGIYIHIGGWGKKFNKAKNGLKKKTQGTICIKLSDKLWEW